MRIEKIKSVLKHRNYFILFLVIFIVYIILSAFLINYFFLGFKLFFQKTSYAIFNIIFTFILAILLGINLSLVVYRFKEARKYNKESNAGIFTGFLSLFGAGCPVCSFTILSLIIPGFSTAFSLAALPFKGLEIQLAAILLLIISIMVLTRENVCKINFA